jgi:glyoxylase-like metal-dependent hydrolase (beta-lactamase superfamily II)
MTGSGNATYLLTAPGRSAVLIDAGSGQPAHLAGLARALGDRGLQLTDVLVTHVHADHASGAPAIAAVHRQARFHKYPHRHDDRYPVGWQAVEAGAAFETVDGSVVAVYTPGHSPDHLAFWHQPSRTIFSGDLVVVGSSVVIDVSSGGCLTDYLASLAAVLALDAAILLPAHGPAITDPPAVLQAYIAHRQQREEQVIDALRRGLDTVTAIAESIYDGLAAALMPSARQNVRAHLEKLQQEQRAFEEHERWTL